MEELDKKINIEELEELMEKISIEMERSRARQVSIDGMLEELYNETRPMMVEKRKEEIETAKNDKAEFDEMTKNALINAKKAVLQLREDSEKEYQAKLLETVNRKKEIQSRLLAMKQKGLPAEKLMKAEEAANRAIGKVNDLMKEFQNNHFELRNKLEDYEKNIWDDALELGVEKEIDVVTLDETNAGPTNVGPTNAGPTNAGPTNAGPTNAGRTNVGPTNAGPTEPKLKWHKDLTPDQIEEAISREIYEPEGQEYDQFLREHGIIVPTNQGPIKPGPTNPGPTNPGPTNPGPTNPGPTNPVKPDIKQINRIVVNPLKDELEYYFNDQKVEEVDPQTSKDLIYGATSAKSTMGILKQYGPDLDWDSVKDALDPNIVQLIANTSGEKSDEQLARYFGTLKGEKSDLDIVYNLKDVYNSKLDYKTIKNMIKIAKEASKSSKGAIKIEKDPLLKRLVGNIKKRIESADIKLLPIAKEDGKSEKINESQESEDNKTPKEKTKEKTSILKRFTSKKLPRSPEFFRRAQEELAVSGVRIVGYLKGENKLTIDNNVRNMRASFVPKAKVNEEAAVAKAKASQGEPSKGEPTK